MLTIQQAQTNVQKKAPRPPALVKQILIRSNTCPDKLSVRGTLHHITFFILKNTEPLSPYSPQNANLFREHEPELVYNSHIEWRSYLETELPNAENTDIITYDLKKIHSKNKLSLLDQLFDDLSQNSKSMTPNTRNKLITDFIILLDFLLINDKEFLAKVAPAKQLNWLNLLFNEIKLNFNVMTSQMGKNLIECFSEFIEFMKHMTQDLIILENFFEIEREYFKTIVHYLNEGFTEIIEYNPDYHWFIFTCYTAASADSRNFFLHSSNLEFLSKNRLYVLLTPDLICRMDFTNSPSSENCMKIYLNLCDFCTLKETVDFKDAFLLTHIPFFTISSLFQICSNNNLAPSEKVRKLLLNILNFIIGRDEDADEKLDKSYFDNFHSMHEPLKLFQIGHGILKVIRLELLSRKNQQKPKSNNNLNSDLEKIIINAIIKCKKKDRKSDRLAKLLVDFLKSDFIRNLNVNISKLDTIYLTKLLSQMMLVHEVNGLVHEVDRIKLDFTKKFVSSLNSGEVNKVLNLMRSIEDKKQYNEDDLYVVIKSKFSHENETEDSIILELCKLFDKMVFNEFMKLPYSLGKNRIKLEYKIRNVFAFTLNFLAGPDGLPFFSQDNRNQIVILFHILSTYCMVWATNLAEALELKDDAGEPVSDLFIKATVKCFREAGLNRADSAPMSNMSTKFLSQNSLT